MVVNSDSLKTMRETVKWLTGIMTVPLVQNLIHHTYNIDNKGGSDMVELYALGILPRVATCDPHAYETLLALDILNDLSSDGDDENKAIAAIQQAYSCLGVTCESVGSYMGGVVPTCEDDHNGITSTRGGYKATSKASWIKANIDRDILQIDIFLKYKSNTLAMDWYKHGWNSDVSLQRLASNNFVPELPASESPYFSLYAEYYGSANFVDERIHTLLKNDGNGRISTEQMQKAVTSLFEYVLMVVTTADSLKYAALECANGRHDLARQYADAGAMFYIGSMQGRGINSRRFHDGKSLFATAHDLCTNFGTCVDNGDNAGSAAINELIITSLTSVAQNIDSSECSKVASLVDDTILPALSVPLIQGILKYAASNQELSVGTGDADLAIGDALSRGILPLVNKASPASAETIKAQMEYQVVAQPVASGFKSVADAFRGNTLSLMGIECSQVGVLATEPIAGAMCGDGNNRAPEIPSSGGGDDRAPEIPSSGDGDNRPQEIPSSPEVKTSAETPLGFGRYTFSDPKAADIDAAFALDVRDMFHADTGSDGTVIYTQGANALTSNVFARNSDVVTGTPSLASLSTLASRAMSDDPMFNIYKYALYEDSDLETSSGEQQQQFSYADDVVMEALTNGNDAKLAAESTVILQIFMVITHKLYSAVRVCDMGNSPESEIDSAVALWLGTNQGEGKFEDGWMMYSIAQSVQKFFGYTEEEAPVNTRLMSLFLQAQTAAKGCADDNGSTSDGSLKRPSHESSKLRYLSQEIIRSMTEPLIKSLLFHMTKNSKNMVELYAVAIIPQCAACDPEASKALQNALFSGYDQQTSLTDDVLEHFATFLRCQEITCEHIKTGRDADRSLTNLAHKLCARLGVGLFETDLHPLASYIPQYSVIEEARLDLDALEIYIMMQTQAYGAAQDIYTSGHNARSHDGSTLASFANKEDKQIVPINVHKIISQTINKTSQSQYSTATRAESAEIIRRALQSMVSHNAVLAQMQASVDACKNGSVEKAREEWDKAVAYFVGSMEGRLAGGRTDRHGVLLYALGNEFCQDFNNCEASGEATVNQELMFNFASGRDSLVDGECDHLMTLVPTAIKPKLLIPLIQGVISSSMRIRENPTDPELLATIHILSQAIIPHIQAVNSKSASLLTDAFWSDSGALTNPVVSDVIEAFGSALEDLGIPCDSIGSPNGHTICVAAKTEDTPTKLADNLYVTTTYVQDRANIALDIKDMAEALAQGNTELAQLIYRKGKNAEKYDDNGNFLNTRTVKELSTNSTADMLEDPEFNMFMYTLGTQKYGDALVEKAMASSNTESAQIATEAALVLNIWMEIVHLMHETLRACKNKQLRDDDGVFLMDAAVAYWIGDGQVAGDADNGHLLYALSERFGMSFSIDNANQSRTNTNILRLFNEAKNEVSLPNACSESQMTYKRLRGIVNRLIPQMAVPLIQGLIFNLRATDRERVKIYAHAFIPLVAGCRLSLYESLKEKLLSNQEYNVVDVEAIIDLIRQSYNCLGLECDDIGVHLSEETDGAPRCKDSDADAHLAGYEPASDIRDYSRLDLDIREMDVLLQMKAYSAVEELYMYGKHARGGRGVATSIGQLATTKHRSIVPQFDAFVQYYSSDTYADDIIHEAIDPLQVQWTDEQRRTVVIKASQVLVMYFAALQYAYEAVSECGIQMIDTDGPSIFWDRAAAILIGSLEGTKKNGTIEGYMLYDLAQEHCVEFGTCIDEITDNYINQELLSLLFTGRGAALSNSCRALEKAADELSSLLLIPIIQGALHTSIGLTGGEDLERRAEAYVYSRALLPFIRKRNAANDLDLYLGNSAPSDKRHTASKVYAALSTAYPRMDIDCEEIGSANGIDTCSNVVYVSDYLWIIIVSVTALMLGCCCGSFAIFFHRRKNNAKKRPENNQKFIPSSGEMNHSMDLLEKAFSSFSKTSKTSSMTRDDMDAETDALNRQYIESRSDKETNSDTFSDEFNSDHLEVVALNSKHSGDII
uniref:Uncharacterized protein n=1 Tax=Pseudo-nitzschia australis TaxID=44445 RepID=A0A7S4AQH0_9STRA